MVNPSLENSPNLDDWVELGAGETITLRSGKVDIGQHVTTAVALIAAEELDVEPSRIHIPLAETGIAPNEGITSGSMSMEHSGEAIRRAAATAKRHLMGLAAEKLGVGVDALEVSDGLVRAQGTNETATYWDLLGGEKFNVEVDEEIALKAPGDFKYMGKKTIAREMQAIVTGGHKFLHDMSWPDMLHARLVRPPHYTAKLKSIDQSARDRLAEQGLILVEDGSFLAIAGQDEYTVVKAAERFKNDTEWDMGAGLEPQDVFERLTTNARVELPVVDGIPIADAVTPLGEPPANATATLSARFEKPYTMHGSIAPSAAAAYFADDKLNVWSHSQGIYLLRLAMADALEMEPKDVTLTHALSSGCYG
ncbi:MAG: molybdopterin-dependent oxidoreductase, partial [Rhodospirillales bacterium]|nr:molybdopterin-dependent oxidoreductase [Rhodospirillales bacterium]